MDNTTIRYAMALISGIAVLAMANMTFLTMWGYADSPVVLVLSNIVSVVVGAIAGWVVAPKKDGDQPNQIYPQPPASRKRKPTA